MNDDVSTPRPSELASVIAQLREQASTLPAPERDVALEHVQALEEHASAETMNLVRMKSHLKGLEVFAPLVPYVASVLNSLSNVGA
jgi:hypothetical protein